MINLFKKDIFFSESPNCIYAKKRLFFIYKTSPLPHGGRAATQGDFPLGALTEQSPLALIIFNIQYLDSDSDY